MAKMPDIKGPDRNKPVCYDPQEDRFITIDDLIARRAAIVPLEHLSNEQKKNLVVERNRVGGDYTVQAISGTARNREEVIKEIEANTEFGSMAVKAELMYLQDLLRQIEDAL